MTRFRSRPRNFAAMLCAVPLLYGCLSTHVEPTSGPRAQMRFVGALDGSVVNVNVLSFANEKCEGRKLVAELNGIAVQHNRKKIGMPLADQFEEKEFSEIHVEAGKPLIFTMGVWAGSVYSGILTCYVTTTFQPAESLMYEATFAADSDGCGVRLQRIERAGSGYVRVMEESKRVLPHSCTINGVEHFEPAGEGEAAQKASPPPAN